MNVFTAILAAAAPTAAYTLLLWWLDRYEKEPLPLLLAAFGWGAVPAILLAVLFEFVLAVPFEHSPIGPDITTWGLSPVIEELLKAAAVVALFRWARNEFDGPLDGIVYGALVGFGFSMTENALYFLRAPDVTAIFWLRSVFFGMNHAFFTAIVGLAVGAVRYRHGFRLKLAIVGGGLALAILLHALHNLLVVRFALGGAFFAWLIQSTGVLVLLATAALAWRHERAWMLNELGDEVRGGVLSAADYATIVSSSRRLRQQLHALANGGWHALRRTRRLHHLATELAFCKSKIQMADRFQSCDETDRLRREIVALRETMEQERVAWGEM